MCLKCKCVFRIRVLLLLLLRPVAPLVSRPAHRSCFFMSLNLFLHFPCVQVFIVFRTRVLLLLMLLRFAAVLHSHTPSWVIFHSFFCKNMSYTIPALAIFTDVPIFSDAMNKSSICNVIFILMIFALCEEYTFDTRTLLFAFPFFCQSESAFAQCWGSPPANFRHCNFLHLCHGGKDAFSCNAWHCWFHQHFKLLSFWRLSTGIKFFNFIRRNIVNRPLLVRSLYLLGFSKIQLLLCILFGTFEHGRPHFSPLSM